jgi:hypothetical protein
MQTAYVHSPARLRLLAATLLLSAFGAANAAVITWDTPATITGDGDVSTTGTALAAFNINGASTTVNGVNFDPFAADWGSTNGSATVGNFTMTGGTYVFAYTATSTSPVYTSLSAAYQELVGTALSWPYPDMTLTMGGLTVGQQYQFQVWANHAADENYLYGLFVDNGAVHLSAGDSQQDQQTQQYVLSSLGDFVTGTFTADASSQDIVFGADEVGYINAFQLRALDSQPPTVPEPGSLVLAGLGLATLGWSRRARR